MVIAKVKIVTCYGDAVIPVQVARKGPRPGTAWVYALNGLEPFTMITHGGPVQVRQALISTRNLCEVHVEGSQANEEISPPLQIETPTPVSEPNSEPEAMNSLALDAFLESAYEDRTWIQ